MSRNKKSDIEHNEEINEGYNINSDESISGSEHLTDSLDEDTEVEKYKKEAEDCKDRYLRLAAEFDNYRKRTAKERVELFQTAGKDVITDLLEVLDDADRAVKQFEESDDVAAIKAGVTLIFNKLRNILQSKGLTPMEATGKEFDPELHDAIAEIPAPTEDLKGKVADEVTKGYYLNDKIIRHAKVVVGK